MLESENLKSTDPLKKEEKTLDLVIELVKKTLNFVKKRETGCIQCAKCAEVCPRGLYPVFIKEAIEEGNLERAKRLFIMDCIVCVLCTNVCPSGILLADRFRQAKEQILEIATDMGHID